ncbi:MAG: hypothetical protein PW845_25630 [Pseudomonas sp.]|uniref:hypothetical protein n=1 Tax=Pseudomonas abieticivorans TaxID=2931382 RepID=UPI0020BD574C|nr:hypothetical protein [Pseudomonas sp. PIA16]MDE1168670.1 hypothetical protein [Pseudomonas sp.]
MRKALAFSLLAAILGGCASNPADRDIGGTWINQAAIDAASKGGSLREALQANGPNLEWDVNTKAGQARYTNGFENVEGKLVDDQSGTWKVDFYGSSASELRRDGRSLHQAATENEPDQTFEQAKDPAPEGAPLGANFERALYGSYLGGSWKIASGPGEGSTVQFQSDGSVQGLPGADRYALCLAGDCASMSGGNDTIWLQQAGQGNSWVFTRKGKKLDIFQAVNNAHADEMPTLSPGAQQWELVKQ